MAYNPAIPQANDIPAQSQQFILNNFTAIDNFVNTDHSAFNIGALQGAHNKVSFIPQIASIGWPAPGITFGLYATAAGIFVHNALLGAIPEVNITIKQCTTNGLGSGYFYLPCGILVQFGYQATTPGRDGFGKITYPIQYPAGHRPYMVLTGNQATTPVGFSTYASVNDAAIHPDLGITNISCDFNLRRQDPTNFRLIDARGHVYWVAIGI